MSDEKDKTGQVPPMADTTTYSKDYLYTCEEQEKERLLRLKLFSDMQRVYLCDLIKKGIYSDAIIEELEQRMEQMQVAIVSSLGECKETDS